MKAYHVSGQCVSTDTASPAVVRLFRGSEQLLAAELPAINGLNVFPVPDGDTGTNMLATLRRALQHADEATTPVQASQQLAVGAVLGARGNSGVLLAQLLRAGAEALEADSEPRPESVARMLRRAVELAYEAASHPVEGTLLSVLRAAADVPASASSAPDAYLLELLWQARAAVARTPDQLAVLRQAQVVDAGGYGLLLVFRGWHRAWLDRDADTSADTELLGLVALRQRLAAGHGHPSELVAAPSAEYGYCVSVVVRGAAGANLEEVRRRVEQLGSSVLAAPADDLLSLHAHVEDPGPLLAYAGQLGIVERHEITNIDSQTAAGETAQRAVVLALAPGAGLAAVFRSLGAEAVLPGAGLPAPTLGELLRTIDGFGTGLGGSREVLLLPGSAAARVVAAEAAGQRANVSLLAIESIPAAIAAALAYRPEQGTAANVESMAAAAEAASGAELRRAPEEGELQAWLGGRLLGTGEAALPALLAAVPEGQRDLATLYYGAGMTQAQAHKLGASFQALAPGLEIEILRGDQPEPACIIAFE